MHTKQNYYFEEARANLWATIFISKCSFVSKEKNQKRTWSILLNCIPIPFFSLCRRFFLLPFDSQKWWNGKRFRKSIPSKFITRTVCCIYQPLIYRLKCCPSAVLAIILIRRTPNRSIVFQTVCFSLRLSSFNLFSIYWRIGEWQHNWPCFALCRTRMHLCSGYNTLADAHKFYVAKICAMTWSNAIQSHSHTIESHRQWLFVQRRLPNCIFIDLRSSPPFRSASVEHFSISLYFLFPSTFRSPLHILHRWRRLTFSHLPQPESHTHRKQCTFCKWMNKTFKRIEPNND